MWRDVGLHSAHLPGITPFFILPKKHIPSSCVRLCTPIFWGRIIHTMTLKSLICTILACAGGLYQEVAAQPTATRLTGPAITGHVEVYAAFPAKHIPARQVEVWLPPSYATTTDRRYPVLYMHDGQNVFNAETSSVTKTDWGVDEAMDSLIRAGIVQEAIVVAVWCVPERRRAEYLPEEPRKIVHDPLFEARFARLSNSHKPQSNAYLDFLVSELKPFIDKTYRSKTDRDNTFIMGSSMGGLISLYAICRHPEVFGAAGCVSTHWVIPQFGDGFIRYLRKGLPEPKTHRLYFDYGTATLDISYGPFQDWVDEIVQLRGFTHANWVTRRFDGAEHSERAWRARVHIPLTYLLAKP